MSNVAWLDREVRAVTGQKVNPASANLINTLASRAMNRTNRYEPLQRRYRCGNCHTEWMEQMEAWDRATSECPKCGVYV